MSNAIHPLDFDEQQLDGYYTKRDAITALILASHTPIGTRYALVNVPGTELTEAEPHSPFSAAFLTSERELGKRIGYPALVYDGEESAKPNDDVADVRDTLTRLSALIDKHGTVEDLQAQVAALRANLATAHEALGAAKAVLNQIDLDGNKESIAVGVVLMAIGKALTR